MSKAKVIEVIKYEMPKYEGAISRTQVEKRVYESGVVRYYIFQEDKWYPLGKWWFDLHIERNDLTEVK